MCRFAGPAVHVIGNDQSKFIKLSCLHYRKLEGSGLNGSAAVAKLLTMQGAQSVAVNTLPWAATEPAECCLLLLQSLGQSKSVAEAAQTARDVQIGGVVVYGLICHKTAVK